MEDISLSLLSIAAKASSSCAIDKEKRSLASLEMLNNLKQKGIHVVIADKIKHKESMSNNAGSKNSKGSAKSISDDESGYSFFGDERFIFDANEFDYDDYGLEIGDKVPDFSIDPDSLIFTVINYDPKLFKAFFISFLQPCLPIYGLKNCKLNEGMYINDDGTCIPCVTLIMYLPPMTVVDCCKLTQYPSQKKHEKRSSAAGKGKQRKTKTKTNPSKSNGSTSSQDKNKIDNTSEKSFPPALFSDIRPIQMYLDPSLFELRLLENKIPNYGSHSFPLEGPGPYLCSQGMGELFTHHFAETFHAIDLDCPTGTKIIAVADGEIIDIKQDRSASGIHCCNLWAWNSLAIKMDNGGGFVEYVHIRKDSVNVKVGDKVKRGQIIAETGDVGFCPTPHLHIQFHLSDDPKAPTVPFAFNKMSGIDNSIETLKDIDDSCGDEPFVPITGCYYNSNGLVKKN